MATKIQSFQDRTLDHIAGIITAYSDQNRSKREASALEVSIRFDYSNRGFIYVHWAGDVGEPLIEIGFDFQSGYQVYSLTVLGEKIPSQVGRPDYFPFYDGRFSTQKYEHSRFWGLLNDALIEVTEAE